MNNNYAAQHALPPITAPLRFAAQVKRRPLYCQRQSCALSRLLVKGRWGRWVAEAISAKSTQHNKSLHLTQCYTLSSSQSC
jgi:hypothetical protein